MGGGIDFSLSEVLRDSGGEMRPESDCEGGHPEE